MFRLTEKELEEWKSQNLISNKEKMGLRKLPNVFTEQGNKTKFTKPMKWTNKS